MIMQCVAIVGLVAIELYALHQRVNGKLLAMVTAVIGGIAGYTISISRVI